MEDLNKKLDSLMEDYFHVLGEIFMEYKELESLMKMGFLSLSQAKKFMGVHMCGAAQYNHNMIADTGAHVVQEDGILNFKKCDPHSCCEDEEESKSGLRKRGDNEENGVSDLVDSIQNMKMKDDKVTVNGTTRKDPIKMFGVLTPQSLRTSQDRFRRAVDLTLSIASLKSKLTALKQEYKECMKTKSELLKEKEHEHNEELSVES